MCLCSHNGGAKPDVGCSSLHETSAVRVTFKFVYILGRTGVSYDTPLHTSFFHLSGKHVSDGK